MQTHSVFTCPCLCITFMRNPLIFIDHEVSAFGEFSTFERRDCLVQRQPLSISRLIERRCTCPIVIMQHFIDYPSAPRTSYKCSTTTDMPLQSLFPGPTESLKIIDRAESAYLKPTFKFRRLKYRLDKLLEGLLSSSLQSHHN